jgi:hypothetical protein
MPTLLRRAENVGLSLGALDAMTQIRAHLDRLEVEATRIARDQGATIEDIAEALDVTPQTIYYRLKHYDAAHRPRRAKAEPTATEGST